MKTEVPQKTTTKAGTGANCFSRLVSIIPQSVKCACGCHKYESQTRSIGFGCEGTHYSYHSEFCKHCDEDKNAWKFKPAKQYEDSFFY